MKKLILLLMAVLVITPMTSYGQLGFLNITPQQLTRLDATTFRLRVTYDWGGRILPALIGQNPVQGFPTPTLMSFDITGFSGFNFFNQTSANTFVRNGTDVQLRSIGNQYGFDFSVNDPLASSFSFLTQGQIQWIYPTQTGTGSLLGSGIAATENYNGQFTLTTDPPSVPEPASVFLLGLGLLGVVIVKRRK
jgi:hypothetical protein